MYTEERQARERVTTNLPLALTEDVIALLDQPLEDRVRGLVRLCRQLSRQYQAAEQNCLTRAWWRRFNQAGIQLREALDHAKTEGYPGLNAQETEHAYYLLIHVAYFFEPGGIAEALWPLLPAEPGERQAQPPANAALGFSFAPPPVPAGGRVRQQVRRWKQRLGHILGRSGARERGAVELLALPAQSLPCLEETAQPCPPAARRPSDGTYSGC